MASIVKRKNRYSVVYTYTDENGVKRQKWEIFATNAEAKKRKVQVEFEQETGTFIIPNASTVSDLLEEYMSIYGVNTWAMSTYEARRSLIFNYINPLIGDMKLEDVTPRTMDKYYQSLLMVKAKVVNNHKPTHEYLTAHTVREIHKLLRNAFNQGVKWELMSRNPVQNATLPKEERKERDIWTIETVHHDFTVRRDKIHALSNGIRTSNRVQVNRDTSTVGLFQPCLFHCVLIPKHVNGSQSFRHFQTALSVSQHRNIFYSQ